MKIILFIIMFLCIGAFFIISQNDLALVEEKNLEEFSSLYRGWLSKTWGNLGGLTGHVVKMEWLPQ